MRTLILFFLLLIPISLLAPRGGTLELYMWTSGFSPTTEVDFYLDACGPIWDEDKDLTTSASLLSSTVNIPEDHGGGFELSHGDDWDNGWDFVTAQNTSPAPVYAWGLYKISTDESDTYFYIDFRDHRWPDYDSPYTGHETDTWLRYDEDNDEFAYSPGDGIWDTASVGEYVTLWGMKEKGDPSVGDFEDYWINCLNLTVTGNEHPRIVWGPHPTFKSPAGYKVYRAVSVGETSNPDTLTYSHEGTTNSSTFNWIDPDIIIGGDYNYYYYYVKAYNGRKHSLRSNIVYTPGQMYKLFGEKNNIVPITNYKLNQNYPNPFNPVTNISFKLPEETAVQLKIYDIQGKVVSTLINKKMAEGTHSVSFNSNGLPSGVYFYKLQTTEFTDIKRMLLLK